MKLFSLTSHHFWLVLILILAAFLRLDQINQPFVDLITWREADNATIADHFYRGNWNILYPQISWNGPEPNYVGYEFQTLTYLAGLLYRLVGQHDWVGRSIAVGFGVWGIFAFYKLICRVWDSQRALVSAAILAVLPGAIFVDRSFISDPIMVSLATTSLWLLVVYLQTGTLSFLILASLVGILGFLTKVSGLIVGIPMIYAMVSISKQTQKVKLRQFAPLAIASILVLIPVVAYYLWARHIYLTYPPHHIAAAGNWIWDHNLTAWLSEYYYLPELIRSFDHWLWTKPIIALVLLGLCLKPPGAKAASLPTRLPWLFHWWGLAMVIYYLVGAKELVDNPWNFHLVNPAAAALAGHAVVTVALLISRSASSHLLQFRTVLMVLITLVLVVVSGDRYKDLYYGWSPYRAQAQAGYELGLALNQITQPSDLAIAIAEEIGNPVGVYYSKRQGWIFPPVWSDAEWWDDIKNDEAAIASLNELEKQDVQWLGIVAQQKQKIWQNNPKLAQHIDRFWKVYQSSPAWTIYRIAPQSKSSNSS